MNSARHKTARRAKDRLSFLVVVLVVGVSLLPVYWIFTMSIKARPDIFAMPPQWVPLHPTLENFRKIFFNPASTFLPYLKNSVVVAVSTSMIALFLGSLAGYALARARPSKFKDNLSFYIISTRMMPAIVTAIPLYLMLKTAHLINTLFAIILAHTSFTLPMVVWFMKGFFEAIPKEIDEAARIDGCSLWQVFRYVSLPLVRPGLAAAAILTFIFSWNEFLFALLLSGMETKTLSVAIVGFQSSIGTEWGKMAAGTVVAAGPVVLFGLLLNRYLIRGLTAGAINE